MTNNLIETIIYGFRDKMISSTDTLAIDSFDTNDGGGGNDNIDLRLWRHLKLDQGCHKMCSEVEQCTAKFLK